MERVLSGGIMPKKKDDLFWLALGLGALYLLSRKQPDQVTEKTTPGDPPVKSDTCMLANCGGGTLSPAAAAVTPVIITGPSISTGPVQRTGGSPAWTPQVEDIVRRFTLLIDEQNKLGNAQTAWVLAAKRDEYLRGLGL